ncbi:IclR family transcriptional regulator [Micrococcus sp.]|uniref:IclR family transcriptional regulator n=1 Tax=Micrococcus sp. TaxID=1271 RepID=UPI002A90878D|nr:helix-turn-helix domain-containing protein [Micrococcus sp.]MDY6055988.1 helix-turn-helix domain-containing protein [Micrococcus sp.]
MPATSAPASTRTVDRALELLAAVTDHAPVTLTDAARTVDLPASTALRLLRSLELSGLVARDEAGLYRPGPRLIQLGARAFTREPLVRLAHDPMEEVVRRTGESVYLAVQADAETAVYLAIVEGTHSVRHTSWVGRTVPLEGTAVGRALRGQAPAGGHVLVADTVEPDVTALSAPVMAGGVAAGALSTLVPAYRCTEELAQRCAAALVDATAQMSQALGGPAS